MSGESSATDFQEAKPLDNTMPDYIECSGAICWHLDKIPFSEEVTKKAEIELNEKSETRSGVLEGFRKMITEKADFTTRTDDEFLLQFLRPRKFNLERAYRLLQNFYTAMAKYIEIFPDPRPSIIKRYLFRNFVTILPYREPGGKIIVVLRLGDIGSEKVPFSIAVRLVAMSLVAAAENPVTQVHGIIGILDFSGMTLKSLAQLATPTNLHTIFVLLQDCLPGRVKEKHMVFGSKVFRTAYEAAKHVMNTKMRERVVFHDNDVRSIHKYIPPEILPEEYGGTLQLDRNMWPERLLSMEQNFIELFKQGYTKKFPVP